MDGTGKMKRGRRGLLLASLPIRLTGFVLERWLGGQSGSVRNASDALDRLERSPAEANDLAAGLRGRRAG